MRLGRFCVVVLVLSLALTAIASPRSRHQFRLAPSTLYNVAHELFVGAPKRKRDQKAYEEFEKRRFERWQFQQRHH